jgi:hypothetical protein
VSIETNADAEYFRRPHLTAMPGRFLPHLQRVYPSSVRNPHSSGMTERNTQLQQTCRAGGDVLLDSPLFGLFGQTEGVLSSVAVLKVVEAVERYVFAWWHSASIHSRPVLCTGLDVPLRTACLPAREHEALTSARVLVRTKRHPVERLMAIQVAPGRQANARLERSTPAEDQTNGLLRQAG